MYMDIMDEQAIPKELVEQAKRVRKIVETPDGMEFLRDQIEQWLDDRDRRRQARENDRTEFERFRGCYPARLGPPKPDWIAVQFGPEPAVDAAYDRVKEKCRNGGSFMRVREIQFEYWTKPPINCWVPPHLASQNWAPEYESPLPLSQKRLSFAEKCAIAAGICDATYKGVQRIDPLEEDDANNESRITFPHTLESLRAGLSSAVRQSIYLDLVREVRRIPETDFVSITAIVDEVCTFFNASSSAVQPAECASERSAVELPPGRAIEDSDAAYDETRIDTNKQKSPRDYAESWNTLSLRQRECMQVLHERQAFGVDERMTCEVIAHEAGSRDANVNGFKSHLAGLVECGLVKSKKGREGGYWLTERGRSLAEKHFS